MRTVFMAILAIPLIASSTAVAAPGDVESRTATSLGNPTGLAWTGSTLWMADRGTDMFYEVDISTGAVTDSLTSPGWFPSGLAWHDGLLWSTDPGTGRIYATDPSRGLTVKTIESPVPSPTGIAWNGDRLWISDNREDVIMMIDPEDGTTIESFRAPAGDTRGIVFGGGRLWCADRMRDEIYMVDAGNGMVVMILEAPGEFPWGLSWKDSSLLVSDYQEDAIFALRTADDEHFVTSDPRKARVAFLTEAVPVGTGTVESLSIYYAVPGQREGQRILDGPYFEPRPKFVEDEWGQRIAAFEFAGLAPGSGVEVSMEVDVEVSAVRYFLDPGRVGGEIPDDIAEAYLADEVKYDIHHPYVQGLVEEIAGDEENLYWKARKLYQYLIENMEYEMVGGWNTAPTVLKRKTGSCSEYTFCFIALCRAAGVPARYVGSLVVRGDDASYDDVFHRWNEVYLPGYGWVPVDANAGDKRLPADQGRAFGGISNRFLITTEGGGGSKYLGWSYNHMNRWITSGKCDVRTESVAEWEPME